MVSRTEAIDQSICVALQAFTEWDERVQYVCSLALNQFTARRNGKKVQRCSNEAYIYYTGRKFQTYSESALVSGLMRMISAVLSTRDDYKTYQPKFIELLKDSIPESTLTNILQAFREC